MESGATFPELTDIVVGAIDLQQGLIYLPGGAGTVDRIVPLNDWSATRLKAHFTSKGFDRDDHAVFGGKGPTDRTSTMKADLHRVLELAGLAGRPGVTTYSVRGWLGRQVWDATSQIHRVARRLGLDSTDRAWDVIDIDWRQLP